MQLVGGLFDDLLELGEAAGILDRAESCFLAVSTAGKILNENLSRGCRGFVLFRLHAPEVIIPGYL